MEFTRLQCRTSNSEKGGSMLHKIISGGQCGADMGGLLAAEELGIPTGGWAPYGWRTELGPNPELGTRFGLKEHVHPAYPHRTAANVQDSDGTVIIGRISGSRGSELTMALCEAHDKPYFTIPSDPMKYGERSYSNAFLRWLQRNDIRILNVAGNRESRNPGIEQKTKLFLVTTLKRHFPQQTTLYNHEERDERTGDLHSASELPK